MAALPGLGLPVGEEAALPGHVPALPFHLRVRALLRAQPPARSGGWFQRPGFQRPS